MMDMQNMMKQAQKLQKQIQDAQAELKAMTFTGKSAQDLVTVDFTGDKKIQTVAISPDLIDPSDPDTLQDMVLAAVTDALAQIDRETAGKLGQFGQGLPL